MTRRFMVHVSREFANAINLNEETSYCRLRRWLIGPPKILAGLKRY